jgi:polysaccharide deacetylase family sporulation protein PdaB
MKKILICFLSILIFTTNIYADDNIIINHGNRDKKMISLTFDDGPHPTETDKVLDVLKKYDVKATFFIAGKHVQWYPKPLLRAVNEGHEIGNHTFNHPDISNLSTSQIEKELKECEEILFEATKVKTNLFRPPYGSYNQEELSKIAKDNGYKIILWSTIDARDWQNPPASEIAQKIINNAKGGDIILLHDYATDNTVEALEILIPTMQKMGFEFVTVSKILEN